MPLIYTPIDDFGPGGAGVNGAWQIAQGSSEIGELIIPGSYLGKPVRRIAELAFFGSTTITKLIIPSSITRIYSGAFHNCANLTEIIIAPDGGMLIIDPRAFKNCSALKKIFFPDRVSFSSFSIGDGEHFAGCTSLVSVRLMTTPSLGLPPALFNGCISLKSIVIPAGVDYLGDSTFRNCTNLSAIYFLGNCPLISASSLVNTHPNLKLYRKKNFVTGWPSSVEGVPVVIMSNNSTSPYDKDALKYIKIIESTTLSSRQQVVPPPGFFGPEPMVGPYLIRNQDKDRINRFIKRIKKVIPWQNFRVFVFRAGQASFALPDYFTGNQMLAPTTQTFGGLYGENYSINFSVSTTRRVIPLGTAGRVPVSDEGISPNGPRSSSDFLAATSSNSFGSIRSVFGVFKNNPALPPSQDNYERYLLNFKTFLSPYSRTGSLDDLDQAKFRIYAQAGKLYSAIQRSILSVATTNASNPQEIDFNRNKFQSWAVVADDSSVSHYSKGIKKFTYSFPDPLQLGQLYGIEIGEDAEGVIPFMLLSDLVLNDLQISAIHDIYKSTLGLELTNSEL